MTGNTKQTTSASSEPWKAAQPALQQGITGAQNLYNAGVGGQVYQGSTVIPWSAQSQQGMNNIELGANANARGQGLSGQYQGIINNGGMNSAQQQAMSGFQGQAQNPFNWVQQNAVGNTMNLANSQYSVSPELQKVLDAQSSKVADTVNMNASSAGRYGSGANQSLLAENVGNLANQTIFNDYQNFLGRKDSANSNLFNMGQTGMNTQANANAAIGNLGQQAIGNLGTAYTGMQAPNTDLMNVGAMYEDLATRLKNDELRVFNESQNKPWELLGRMNAIASGAGQMGGTQTQTQPGQNPFLTALGYGASGAGLLGSFL